MARRLEGKVAVITGGGNGVGRGIALSMAEHGASIVVNDIGREEDGTSSADKVVVEIIKAGGSAAANMDSVATMEGGERIVNTAIEKFNKVDILVCCAGNMIRKPVIEMTEEDWDSILNVHLKGHFSCSKAAAVEMIKQGAGRIIGVSSRAAGGGGGSSAYSAAKAGILGFTSALAFELREHGITANVLIPSADTQLFPGERPKPPPEHRGIPASLNIDPEYVAPIVTYLATDQAQGITGHIFYASGGDICIYAKPLDVPGETNNMFIRKIGKWTLEELDQVIPSLFGLG
jgi:NAD(P)-dependent dehydrogenase (short-subunit alcohol dehydrogenase family)